jgi:ABC-2 type transport system permease protein
MYALRDYLGADSLNAAMSRYVNEAAFQHPPYTTSKEWLHHIEAVTPDSLQYLLTDMIKTITLYENKVAVANYDTTQEGLYEVEIEVESKKYRSDTLGTPTEIAMNDWVDIGVFGAPDSAHPIGRVLYLKKHKLDTTSKTITVQVPEKPVKVGVDPYYKLIDRTPSDNRQSL